MGILQHETGAYACKHISAACCSQTAVAAEVEKTFSLWQGNNSPCILQHTGDLMKPGKGGRLPKGILLNLIYALACKPTHFPHVGSNDTGKSHPFPPILVQSQQIECIRIHEAGQVIPGKKMF